MSEPGTMLWIVLAAAMFAAALLAFVVHSGMEERDIWSIGIYTGPDPRHLTPHPATNGAPVLTADDVLDFTAEFVADPFLVKDDDGWLMFFEVLNSSSRRGEIAYAKSKDCVSWRYLGVILRETFHLSYPQVFRSENTYFMIPETGEANSVRLYRATKFPVEWTFERELLRGHYLDATISHANGMWWLIALRGHRQLSLHCARQLDGPWSEHASSPIWTGSRILRPAGRLVQTADQMVLFTQDGTRTYGESVYSADVGPIILSRATELNISESSVIGATGSGWNADGMHHVDAQPLTDGQWIAAVDGKFIQKHYSWRKGVRALINAIGCFSAVIRRNRDAATTSVKGS